MAPPKVQSFDVLQPANRHLILIAGRNRPHLGGSRDAPALPRLKGLGIRRYSGGPTRSGAVGGPDTHDVSHGKDAHEFTLAVDGEVPDAPAGHLHGRPLHAPFGRGGDDALAHVVGDLFDVGIESFSDRLENVALGQDPRDGPAFVFDERGTDLVVGHAGRGLSQCV